MSSSHPRFPGADRSQDSLDLVSTHSRTRLLILTSMRPSSLRLNPSGNDAIAENDPPVSAGDYPFNSYVILSGTVRAVDISTGERAVFARYGAGYFTGDIDLFTRRPSIISVEAETSAEAVRLTPKHPRNLLE